jgi:PAS domain-containing protein
MKTKSVAAADVEHGAFRALWKTGLVRTLLATPDGRVFAAGPAACRLFRRTEEEICAIGPAGLADQADKRSVTLLKKRAEKGYARGEITVVRRDFLQKPFS